jgi:hypothetical protein
MIDVPAEIGTRHFPNTSHKRYTTWIKLFGTYENNKELHENIRNL